MLRTFGRDRIRDLLTAIAPDHLLANSDEAEFLGLDEPGFLPYTTVVVKYGAESTIALLPGGERLEVPVRPVEQVLDTTGAGDAFAAGYLSAVILEQDIATACAAGNALAAHAVGRAGAL